MPHFYIHHRKFPKFNLDIRIPFPKKNTTDRHEQLISQQRSGHSNRAFESLLESTGSTTSIVQASNFAASTRDVEPQVPKHYLRKDMMEIAPAAGSPLGAVVEGKKPLDLFDRKLLRFVKLLRFSREERERAKEERERAKR